MISSNLPAIHFLFQTDVCLIFFPQLKLTIYFKYPLTAKNAFSDVCIQQIIYCGWTDTGNKFSSFFLKVYNVFLALSASKATLSSSFFCKLFPKFIIFFPSSLDTLHLVHIFPKVQCLNLDIVFLLVLYQYQEEWKIISDLFCMV